VKRLFASILLSVVCIALHAQDRRWDAALDQYQQICDECIDIRARSAAGERIHASSVAQLLTKLSSLRGTLQDAKGSMSPAQRLRFESIRMRYEEVFGGSRKVSLPDVAAPAGLPLLLEAPRAQVTPYSPLPSAPDTLANPASAGPASPTTAAPASPSAAATAVTHTSPSFGFILYAGVPELYYGAMATLQGERFGGFVKGTLSIPYTQGGYDCLSDGTTAGGYIWTSGTECISRWSVTAGATFSPWRFMTLYAGGGYGSRSILWQDVSGNWATVTDLSATGFTADGGIIFNIGPVSILAGASSIGLTNVTAEFGLGIRF